MDILDAMLRFIDASRCATASALIGSIGRDRNETALRQMLGIKARGLLLHATIRMRQHDCRVFPGGIIVGRGINIGDDIEAVQFVRHRMDVHLTGFVFGQCAVIDEREGVLLVVGSDGLGRRHG